MIGGVLVIAAVVALILWRRYVALQAASKANDNFIDMADKRPEESVYKF